MNTKSPLTAEDVRGHRDRVGLALLLVAGVIAAAWLVTLLNNFNGVFSNPTLLGRLLVSVFVILPLCVASGILLRQGQALGGALFLVAAGALAAGGLELTNSAIQNGVFALPLVGFTLAAIVIVVLAFLANWEIATLLDVDSNVFKLKWDQFRYLLVITAVLQGDFLLFAPQVFSIPEFFCAILLANVLLVLDIYVRPVYQGADTREPWWYKFVGLAVVTILVLAPYIEHTTLRWPIPTWVSWVALAAGLLVGLLELYCRITMRFALGTLTIVDNHKLYRERVYKWVRHPIYTCVMLVGVCYALAFRAPIMAVINFGVALFFFTERIRREDKMLEDHFGEEFRDYKRDTPAFFPRREAFSKRGG
jgi:protein-S-isoprenylcysteine O-methyltransferase Ste14